MSLEMFEAQLDDLEQSGLIIISFALSSWLDWMTSKCPFSPMLFCPSVLFYALNFSYC